MLCALAAAPAYAQGRQGRQAGPPAKETVAPAIPGVVSAGTKVVVVKDGFQSTEGPVTLPDGSLLFTEPGASKIHKIDKNDTITLFLENTNRADGLGFDSKRRLIAVTANTAEVLYPEASKTVLAGPFKDRPNDLVVDKKDGVYFTLTTPKQIFYIPSGGKPVVVSD